MNRICRHMEIPAWCLRRQGKPDSGGIQSLRHHMPPHIHLSFISGDPHPIDSSIILPAAGACIGHAAMVRYRVLAVRIRQTMQARRIKGKYGRPMQIRKYHKRHNPCQRMPVQRIPDGDAGRHVQMFRPSPHNSHMSPSLISCLPVPSAAIHKRTARICLAGMPPYQTAGPSS